jgi:Chaperone of endosialidase
VPNPVLYAGQAQTFYNATSGVVTLNTPSGQFNGPTSSGTANQTTNAGEILTIVSDGTNYLIQTTAGGPVTITAGTIDGTTIGGNSRGNGSFLSLSANNTVSFTAGTASTSTGTGTLQVTGGIGNTGNHYVGGVVSVGSNTASTSTSTGALLVSGGAGIAGAVYAGGVISGTAFGDTTYGAYNVSLGQGSGGYGRGAVIGYSGGAYSGIGYNIRHTASNAVYDKPFGDQTSYLRFDNGGFTFLSNSSTSAGTGISLTSLATINNSGALTTASGITASTGGLTATSGGLTVTAGGGTIAGGLTVTGGNVIQGNGSSFQARYDTSNSYSGYLNWYGMQLGNNGVNYLVAGNTAGGGYFQFYVNNTNAPSGSSMSPNGSLALTISANTNCTFAGTITENSSIVYKENVNPITNALDAVLKLAGVTYDRKNGTNKDEAGLIAEEVYEVLPNLVQLNEEGKPNGIMYTKLTAYLIESIKELNAEITKLKRLNNGTL